MSDTALLLVDFQNDYFPTYPGAKWPLEGTEAAAEQAGQLLATFREKGLPVVHVRHENLTEEAPFFLPNSEGAQIHSSVAATEGEPVIVKRLVNSFRETELKEVLDRMGIKKLIIVGAMSQMCIDGVTRAATDLGYQCSVAHDACAARAMEFNGVEVPAAHVHAAFMMSLAMGYANVASANELLSTLD